MGQIITDPEVLAAIRNQDPADPNTCFLPGTYADALAIQVIRHVCNRYPEMGDVLADAREDAIDVQNRIHAAIQDLVILAEEAEEASFYSAEAEEAGITGEPQTA